MDSSGLPVPPKDEGEQLKQPKRAVALHYREAGELPTVIASGIDALAQKIIELAQQHNIPIHQDDTLARLLGKIDQGAPISKESYRLVAEVISFLYHMNQEWREKHPQLAHVLEPKTLIGPGE